MAAAADWSARQDPSRTKGSRIPFLVLHGHRESAHDRNELAERLTVLSHQSRVDGGFGRGQSWGGDELQAGVAHQLARDCSRNEMSEMLRKFLTPEEWLTDDRQTRNRKENGRPTFSKL
jgi:hypothetical protein